MSSLEHSVTSSIGSGVSAIGTRMISGIQLLPNAKQESTSRKMTKLTPAERRRIFQMVSMAVADAAAAAAAA